MVNRFKKRRENPNTKNHVDLRQIDPLIDKSTEILEDISADISPEKIKRINKDIAQSMARIEESSEILGANSHPASKDHLKEDEKVKKEMEKLKKELES